MDYGKVPLAKRTRSQTALFYRGWYKEKKRAESRGGGDLGGVNRGTGGEARVEGGGANVESGGVACDSGSVAVSRVGSVVGARVEANCVKVGVGSVGFERAETLGMKTVRKSEKGLKKKKNGYPIHGDSKKILKNKKGMKKYKNVVMDDIDYKRNRKSSKSLRSKINKNKSVVSINVDSKKVQESKKGKEKCKNVVVASVDYASQDEIQFLGMKGMNGTAVDDASEHEIQFLGMKDGNGPAVDYAIEDEIQFLGTKDENGTAVDDDEVAEGGLVNLNCSCLEKESESEEFKDRKEVVSPCQKRTKNASVEIDGKSRGVLSQAQSRLGVSKRGKEVIDDISTDSENPDEPSKSPRVSVFHSTESIDSPDSGDLEESESSGEKDGDHSSDEGYEVDNSTCSRNLDDSSSSSEEEYEDDDGEEGNDNVKVDGKETGVEGGLKRGRGRPRKVVSGSGTVDGDGNERSAEGQLKRKKICGLDILVYCEKEDGKIEIEEPKTVAERLRLRQCVSKFRKYKKNKQELGTFNCPFTLTDEELDFSSGDEDETDGHGNTSFSNGSEQNYAQKIGEKADKGKGKVVRPAKRSRNGVFSATPISVDKVLADSIWQKGQVPLENLVSSRDKVLDQETTLPSKFTFEDDDLKPPDKSYWDIEADKLFSEMDFVLVACEIGSLGSSMADNEDNIILEIETDPATCCCQGKHQLVLDEEIGLRCKICSSVSLEIKHIIPPFSKHPWGRLDKKDLGCTDRFNLGELQFQDSSSVYQSGSKQYIHAEGTVWDFIPGIKESMYPHQREGFEFIWKNIAGSIDLVELKKQAFDGGSGCIISHAPGTGKTRLTIAFLQTYMELYQTCRPIIIAPCSMLLTWEEEFRKWKIDIPFHNLNQLEFSGHENEAAANLLRQVGHRGQNKNSIRLVKLYSWKKDRSILGISYRLFEKLARDGVLADGASKKKKQVEHYDGREQVRKMLLELPGLLVLDEGHTPRNDQSLIWKALSRVETQRRIILSGTPFQNNFGELFNTLCLVRPKFTDRIISESQGDSGRKQRRKSSAARWKWVSLTSSIGKDADGRLDELRAMIEPFVHVHKGSILKESLPGLRDSLVVLQPNLLQKALIEVIQGRKNQLELDYLVSLISVHPSLLLGCCLSEKEKLSVDTDKLEMLKFDPEAGVKIKFLMELIRLCGALKEKVIIFSQYVDPLTFLRDQLKSQFDWTEGKEVLYMDGKLDAKQRQSSISFLNDPASEVRVLLASIRACSEGISLVGASRVVLLDVVWNPSVERQAISRAYRLGQKKVVYIYHLITSGTMEGEKYVRQAEKDRLSALVFSSADGGVHKPEISCAVIEDMVLQEMVQHEKISIMFEKILTNQKHLI